MKYALLIAVLSFVLIGGYVLYTQLDWGRAPEVVASERPAMPATPVIVGRTVPEGMHEYRSEQYRFSLLYPEYMKVKEQDEGQGAATITFEDISRNEGFQIFIVPYLEAQVSEERFRMDIPSGVRRDIRDVAVDGAVGAAFTSEHQLLGETSEIWFVQGGYLYEVTTLKELETWFSAILSTWEFIS